MQGCRKMGSESVNGHATITYKRKPENGPAMLMWADPQVNYVVKRKAKSGEVGENEKY